MYDILKIAWNEQHHNGEISLVISEFFPCNNDRAKRVFPLIRHWCTQDEVAELLMYFKEQQQSAITEAKKRAADYFSLRQSVSNLQYVVDNQRLLSTKEANERRKQLRLVKAQCNTAIADSKKLVAKSKRYNRNYSILAEGK